MLAAHAMSDADSVSTLRWNVNGETTGADITASGFPAERTRDAFAHLRTQPNTAVTSVQPLYFVFADSELETPEVDMAVISHPIYLGTGNTNLSGIGAQIELQIADDATFSTNLQTIATFSGDFDGTRSFSTDLRHTGSTPLRYDTVFYWRLEFTCSSSTYTPQISEIWLGRRRQIPRFPDEAYDNNEQISNFSEAGSETGIITRYVRNAGRAVRDVRATIDQASEYTEISTWWTECKLGTRPFFWFEDQLAGTPYLMTPPPRFFAPLEGGPNLRVWEARFEEVAPFVSGGIT